MGNSAQKLSPEELVVLSGLDVISGLDQKKVVREYKKFRKLYPEGVITKPAFRKLAETFLPPQQRTSEFINKLFNAFDTNQSGDLDFKELMVGLNFATSETPEEIITFNFRALDADNNGYLDEAEILYAMDLVFKHNPGIDQRVGPDINTPAKVVKQIFVLVDSNGDGRITSKDLINFMLVNPTKFTYLGLNLIFLP
jgi:Ca2+-binding EF-hand superfamily protein